MPHNKNNDIKTDLKHDNMEFSAATDGDDKLDADDFNREDDGITEKELAEIENAGDGEMAAAYNAAEIDSQTDSDNNLPDETSEDDYYDNNETDEGAKERR